MDQIAPEAGGKRRPQKPREAANALRDWLEVKPRPMTKQRFAELIGCTPSYLSMLLADQAPWPNRQIVLAIAKVTDGSVTPNDLAGYLPGD